MSSSSALLVQVEAAQGAAAVGNSEAANFLIVVTDAATGAGVSGLTQNQFGIINHFSVTGQTMGFSNNITFFNGIGGGAYHVQVKLAKNGKWVAGSYLAQVVVSAASQQGQGTATLTVR